MKCPECAGEMEEFDDEKVCPYCGHVELKELDFHGDGMYYDPRGDDDVG